MTYHDTHGKSRRELCNEVTKEKDAKTYRPAMTIPTMESSQNPYSRVISSILTLTMMIDDNEREIVMFTLTKKNKLRYSPNDGRKQLISDNNVVAHYAHELHRIQLSLFGHSWKR